MADELMGAARWLYSVISGDSQVNALGNQGVWPDNAPANAPYPFTVFSFIASVDTEGAGTNRFLVRSDWQVLVYDRGAQDEDTSHTRASAIASRIDARLQGPQWASVSGATIYGAQRRGGRFGDEIVDGQTVVFNGGVYRVTEQAA